MLISKIKACNPKNPKTLESCAFLRFSIAILFFDQNLHFKKIAMFSIHGFKQVARNYRRIVFLKTFCHKTMCFLGFFNSHIILRPKILFLKIDIFSIPGSKQVAKNYRRMVFLIFKAKTMCFLGFSIAIIQPIFNF
jgi:hypothetical protein